MSELAIAIPDEGALAKPSPDLDALRARYIPAHDCPSCVHYRLPICRNGVAPPTMCVKFRWNVDADDYAQRGVELIESARHCFIVLGELCEWGWMQQSRDAAALRPNTRHEWALHCAQAWGCSRSTVVKAWVVATIGPTLPEDVSPTLVYEIASGLDGDQEGIEAVLDLALARGWSAWDVREIKQLRAAGLLDAWALPTLSVKGGRLVVTLDGRSATVAKLATVKGRSDAASLLARTGLHLLKMRAKVGKT